MTDISLAWTRWMRIVAAPLIATFALACAAPVGDERADEVLGDQELPVLGVFRIEFNENGFEITPDLEGAAELGMTESPLADLPSMGCGGGACTGTNMVALESTGYRRWVQSGVLLEGPWDQPTECGGTPTASDSAVCTQVRVRNLYPDVQLERVYIRMTELTPYAPTTSVSMRSTPWTATADFGEAVPVANGLFRVGELGRATPTNGGRSVRWAFWGQTTGRFSFAWRAIVRGLAVQPTRRAAIAGVDTPSNDYAGAPTSQNTLGASNIDMTPDGRYVVFAVNSVTASALAGVSGSHIIRHDMVTGANVVVSRNDLGVAPANCLLIQNPSISGDGNIVAFETRGCTLVTSLGAAGSTARVYVKNLVSGTVTLASRDGNTLGYPTDNRNSNRPSLSLDGSIVAFESLSTTLIPGTPVRTNCNEIYRYDIGSDFMVHASALRGSDPFDPSQTFEVNPGNPSQCPNGWTSTRNVHPDISADGNYISFTSQAGLDQANDGDLFNDIYVFDFNATFSLNASELWRVSLRDNGTPLSGSTSTSTDKSSISGDGTTVAFITQHTNAISGVTTSGYQVLWRPVAEGAFGQLRLVTHVVGSTTSPGAGDSSNVPFPSLSSSGRFVGFLSAATNLAAVGGVFSPAGTQAYVCDMGSVSTPISLQRCWVASRFESTPENISLVGSGVSVSSARLSLQYSNDADEGYLAYQIQANNWGAIAAGSATTVYVSPASIDPRTQQTSPSP